MDKEKPTQLFPESQLTYLKSEVELLQTELDSLSKIHSEELAGFRLRSDQHLARLHAESDSLLHAGFRAISQLQQKISKEFDESSKLRQLLLQLKLEHTDSISDINNEIERMTQDEKRLKNESNRCSEEIKAHQKRIEVIRRQDFQTQRSEDERKRDQLKRLETQVADEEARIKDLELNLEEHKKQGLSTEKFTEVEIEKVYSALKSIQRIAERQESELKLLATEKEKAKQDCKNNEDILIECKRILKRK